MTKTYLPPNKFYSAVDIPSSADEAGASAPAPSKDAPADILAATRDARALALSSQAALANGFAPKEMLVTPSPLEPAAIDSCQEPVAADLLQALGALSGTDLIHEIFAVKPKHFKLKHKRRLKLPRFAPDYEAMEAAMRNPGAPRALETDPVWADPAPLFLKG